MISLWNKVLTWKNVKTVLSGVRGKCVPDGARLAVWLTHETLAGFPNHS